MVLDMAVEPPNGEEDVEVLLTHTAMRVAEQNSNELDGWARPCESCGGSGTETRGRYTVHCSDCGGFGFHMGDGEDDDLS